jgi:hypothetical protein
MVLPIKFGNVSARGKATLNRYFEIPRANAQDHGTGDGAIFNKAFLSFLR